MADIPPRDDIEGQEAIYRSIVSSIGAANELLEQQYRLSEMNRASAEGRAADLDEINESLRRAAGATSDIASSTGDVESGTDDAANSMRNWREIVEGGAVEIKNIAIGIHDMLFPKAFMDQLNVIQSRFGTIGREIDNQADLHTSTLIKITDDLQRVVFDPDITKRFSQALGGTSMLQVYQGNVQDAMSTINEIISGPTGMLSSMKILKNMNSDIALEMDLLGRGLSLSADQVGTFVSRQISLTGKSGNDMLREVAVYSKQIANITGDNQKIITAGIEQIIRDTENFGNVSVIEAARVTSNLRQMGLGFEDLQGSVKKFQTFESAADSVAALTTVFGIQMDAMEMFKLANEDQGEFLLRMREQFIATGRTVDDLTLAEKRLIREQTGLQDVESVERLFDVDAIIIDADQAVAVAEGAATSMTEALESVRGSVEGIRSPKEVLQDTYNATQGILMAKTKFIEEFKGGGQAAQRAFDDMWSLFTSGVDVGEERLVEMGAALDMTADETKAFYDKAREAQEEFDAANVGGVDTSRIVDQADSLRSVLVETTRDVGSTIGQNTVEGLSAVTPQISEVGSDWSNALRDEFGYFNPGSPSEFGNDIALGVILGINTIPDRVSSVTEEMESSFSDSAMNIANSYSELTLTPTVKPDIQEGADLTLAEKRLRGIEANQLLYDLTRQGEPVTAENQELINSVNDLISEIRGLIESPVPIRVDLDGKALVDYAVNNPLATTGGRLVTKSRGV